MKAQNIKVELISSDSWDREDEESGIVYKKWSGYTFYDGKPYCRASGNETTNPGLKEDGSPKKRWIAINESITKEEREGDENTPAITPEDYGFAIIFESINETSNETRESVTLVRGTFFDKLIEAPLQGWINTRTITDDKGVEKTFRTLSLSFKQETLDFWEDKQETPYILEAGPNEDVIHQILNDLAADYPDVDQWRAKFFPGSSDKKVKNAAKRRELLRPHLAAAEQTKLGLQKETAATGAPAKSPWAKSK
jgi:hypothetical protein